MDTSCGVNVGKNAAPLFWSYKVTLDRIRKDSTLWSKFLTLPIGHALCVAVYCEFTNCRHSEKGERNYDQKTKLSEFQALGASNDIIISS